MSPIDLERQVRAIRLGATLSEMEHVACLRVGGEDAFDALDALCPADLFVRDGQMLHTLLLREDGQVLCDLYLCNDDEELILLAEGLPAPELAEHLRAHLPGDLSPTLTDPSQTHALLSLNGPYAWEVMAGLAGPEVVGLPYLTFFHDRDWTCFRAGKTGEFGYDLLLRREQVAEVKGQILEIGSRMELEIVEAGLEALDHCALENWFFNIRREGRAGLTPVELQLQWRVSYHKDYPGSSALRGRRLRPEGRVTTVVSPQPLATGAPVTYQGQAVGKLINCGQSPIRGDWLGLALLDLPHAHAGLSGYLAQVDGRQAPLCTVAPPLINNRSLFIDLQQHSWSTRQQDEFPPLSPLEVG
jgi:glycine cleavage system aminomethyltransferase T